VELAFCPIFIYFFLKKKFFLVGENSPSLCPTIFSVISILLKDFPLCTLIIDPTNEGNIVEFLDLVKIGIFFFRKLSFNNNSLLT